MVLDPASVDDDTLLEAAKSCPESAILVKDNEGNHLYPHNPAAILITI